MSDALPLPPRPNVEQYKKLAKDLQRASKSGVPGAIRDWAASWIESLARLQGMEITPAEVDRIGGHWGRFRQERPCTLAIAQLFVAREHGFASWPKFSKHLAELAHANSPVSQFEAAVDAIVSGDSAALQKLLLENPKLVTARSTREHRSTLLHYVSANGVEDFRQKTPRNILDLAKLLLQAGAGVNATSEAYGGRSTTLGLTATSWHPENAGVQQPLLELLLEHGARLDGPDSSVVNACLHNGRGPAAEFLASLGARLDLEGAAGVGRLDLVQTFFEDDGTLRPPATPQQMADGFAWACEFGRTPVVDFLLRRGMPVDARLRHHGGAGLHWAAFGGHLDTVRLLLERGAALDFKDESFAATPLGWAIYAWSNSPPKPARECFYQVVALLVQSGAQWDGSADDVRFDPRMLAALRGQLPR